MITQHETSFSLTALVGWRLRQARESGISSLFTEASNGHICSDATGLRLVRAAVGLHRSDLFDDKPDHVIGWVHNSLAEPNQPHKQRTQNVSPAQISAVSEAIRLATDLLSNKSESVIHIDLDHAVTVGIKTIRSTLVEQRGQLIECAAALAQSLRYIVDPELRRLAVTSASLVVDHVGGPRLARLFELGGNAEHVLRLVETIAYLALEPRRGYLRAEAIRQFDNLITTRLYVSGAVGRQAGTSNIVRPFALSHSDGVSRPCDTLALLDVIEAMRPLLMLADRATQADELVELITYNAAMVALSTDAVHWYGPLPHSIESATDIDIFSDERDVGNSVGGAWRALLRGAGISHQCCAASALLSFVEATNQSVTLDHDAITVRQLTPGETAGEGWTIAISGRWPYQDRLNITVTSDTIRSVNIRIPGWATEHPDCGKYVRFELAPNTTEVELDVSVQPRLLSAHPSINDARGRVAVAVGPMIYCLEGADQMRHTLPNLVAFDLGGGLGLRLDTDHPEAYPTVHATGEWGTRYPWPDFATGAWLAYRDWQPVPLDLPVEIVFTPLFAVANRGLWDVAVWIPIAAGS